MHIIARYCTTRHIHDFVAYIFMYSPAGPSSKFNEPSARFAFVDPLLKVLCEVLHCKLSLVILNKDNTYSISERSKADYTMFYLKLGQSMVLLLETKTDKTLTKHSLCQVIGYFLASSDEAFPPLAMVLTQTQVKFVFFPFRDCM